MFQELTPNMTTTELIAKAEENNKWVGHNYERLVKEYNDKWVAVLDMQVIDSDKDLRTLVSRLRSRANYNEGSIHPNKSPYSSGGDNEG